MLHEGSRDIASFVEQPVYSNFKMDSILILVFWFQFTTINPLCICKSRLFLKFQVLWKGSSLIASFVEHPVCSSFKMYSVLILVFLFWFVNIDPKSVYKRHLISKFQVLHEVSRYIASFAETPVCSNFKMYSILILILWFKFAASNPKCICKSRLFLTIQVLREGSSFAASFVEHPVCSNFKMCSVLF